MKKLVEQFMAFGMTSGLPRPYEDLIFVAGMFDTLTDAEKDAIDKDYPLIYQALRDKEFRLSDLPKLETEVVTFYKLVYEL